MRSFTDPHLFARVKRLPGRPGSADDAGPGAAPGSGLIDLSTGGGGRGAPTRVAEALQRATGDASMHRPVPTRGLPEFRAAAARWWQRRHGVLLDPDRDLLVTTGSKEGVGLALLAFLGEGDGLLAPAPSHPIHSSGAALAGGETIPVAVGPDVDFMESLVAAAERSERRPRGLVVSFPSNPTGAVATPDLLLKVLRFAEARDLFVVSDLAFSDLVFDGARAPAMLEIPGARDRTIEFMSLSESYDMPGWRVGFAAGNPALVAAAARVKDFLDNGVFGSVQAAAAVALDDCDPDVEALRGRLQERRDTLVQAFGEAGWRIPRPAATPFAWAPLPDGFRGLSSSAFAGRLASEAGVAVTPGSVFGTGGDGHVRIAFSEDPPTLRLAAERVSRFLKVARAASHHPPERA
jgi:alanine-synthesizing transaminase